MKRKKKNVEKRNTYEPHQQTTTTEPRTGANKCSRLKPPPNLKQ